MCCKLLGSLRYALGLRNHEFGLRISLFMKLFSKMIQLSSSFFLSLIFNTLKKSNLQVFLFSHEGDKHLLKLKIKILVL